jgi:hypothetical protein
VSLSRCVAPVPALLNHSFVSDFTCSFFLHTFQPFILHSSYFALSD